MSDDTFKINFGDAKVLTLPDEGNYTLVVTDYVVKPAKNEESRSKGFNVSLTFQFADPMEGYDTFRVFHNLWVSYDNPWAAKLFFDALTGKSLDSEMDLSDPNEFIGEKVMASLVHESYPANDGTTKTKMAVASPQAFYPVPF
ncbi:MAG: hypothetical protein ABWY25_11800 [Paenisporosarcina sp.]